MSHEAVETREISTAAGRIVFDPEVDEAQAREWLADHPRWFAADGAAVPGAEGDPDLVLIDCARGQAVAKREVPHGWKASLARTGARGFRSERAFRLARQLAVAGIPTPEALACITLPGREACLITRFVEAQTPWTYLLGRGSSDAVRELEQALARAISRLHARGFRHRDLKAPNLLLRVAADRAGPEVLFLDLESAARVAAVTAATRVRDLARLCMSFESAAARLAGVHADSWPRFVRDYLEAAAGFSAEANEYDDFLRRTRRWSARSIERNLVRGRPIA